MNRQKGAALPRAREWDTMQAIGTQIFLYVPFLM